MPRILLVEDNSDNRTIYKVILEHHGYEVVEARDGPEGIQLSIESVPDLILMDISLPTVDGWEATRTIKADPRTAHIPVVALTAHAFVSDEQKARDLGFDEFLRKPVEPMRVLELVRSFVGPPS